MKLQAMLSSGKEIRSSRRYAGAPAAAVSQIAMQVGAGCLDKCVGATTSAACSYCGADINCWRQCGGADALPCIRNCFASDFV
ncbi:hypothetical protein [Chitinophaga vietnamensis]|uniref:hypothetical protein n=1 Tax=Chitinophaga vietnamensis TaxID=2593957 RepID=UPI0011781AFB|nr:hypothetical protein [Chitinophaga vietnamensis]